MADITRRLLIQAGSSLAGSSLLPGAAIAAMGPNDKFDLLIRNCNVLDPSPRLSGMRDIGIRFGTIETIAPSTPVDRSQRVKEAGGKLVTPGLCTATRTRTVRRSAFRPTNSCLSRGRPPSFPRATRARTTSPHSVVSSCPRRARGSLPLSTSA
ncbi:MAG: hypothetical protein ABIO45_08135 [Burkholderiaceae bacterium]